MSLEQSTDARALRFIHQISAVCQEAGAHFDLLMRNRPSLDHIRIDINYKPLLEEKPSD